MELKTKFNRRQRVFIIPFQLNGVVESIKFNGDLTYEVCYWSNYEQKFVWMYEDDLKEEEKGKEVTAQFTKSEEGKKCS